MTSALLPLGLVLFALGAFLQIAEEWQSRGLTDTSYRSLACLTVGPLLLAWWAADAHHWVTALVTGAPGGLALGLFGWKLRAKIRTRFRL